jgi:hypothetical protein
MTTCLFSFRTSFSTSWETFLIIDMLQSSEIQQVLTLSGELMLFKACA